MRIGLNIGKNNIDSVLVNQNGMIVNHRQTFYSSDRYLRLKENIEGLLEFNRENVAHVFIGTNLIRPMIKESQLLSKVGVIRLAGHQPDTLPPCFNWPEEFSKRILIDYETLNGGYDYDGTPITELKEEEIIQATQRLIQKGAECIAICGVFSTFYNDQEKAAAQFIRQQFDIPLICSYELEILGFMERENALILNAALRKEFNQKLLSIQDSFHDLNIRCPLSFTQRNGSILSLKEAAHLPLKTLEAGLINSFIGASKLTQYQDAFVIDMDETTSSIGMIRGGTLSQPAHYDYMDINFDTSFINSIPLGINSPVHIKGDEITIDPAYDVLPSTTPLTLKDAMVICSNTSQGNSDLDTFTAYRIIEEAEKMLIGLYKKISNRGATLPLILVGNASALFPQHKDIVIPPFSQFASAYGAAMAGISYTISQSMQLIEQEKALEELKEQLLQTVLDRGGYNPRVTNLQVAPYSYLPGEWAQVTITGSGDISPSTATQLRSGGNMYSLSSRLDYYSDGKASSLATA